MRPVNTIHSRHNLPGHDSIVETAASCHRGQYHCSHGQNQSSAFCQDQAICLSHRLDWSAWSGLEWPTQHRCPFWQKLSVGGSGSLHLSSPSRQSHCCLRPLRRHTRSCSDCSSAELYPSKHSGQSLLRRRHLGLLGSPKRSPDYPDDCGLVRTTTALISHSLETKVVAAGVRPCRLLSEMAADFDSRTAD